MDEHMVHTADPVVDAHIAEEEAARYAPVSTGAFFGYKVLYGIPVIGWICCLIFSFASKNVNKRNFARANLISLILKLVLTVLMVFAVVKVAEFVIEQVAVEMMGEAFGDLGQVTEVMDELKDGKYDHVIERVENGEFGDHPELVEVLEEVKSGGILAVVDQVQNGGFEEVVQKFEQGAYDELIDKAINGELGDLGALGDLIDQAKNGDFSGIPGVE